MSVEEEREEEREEESREKDRVQGGLQTRSGGDAVEFHPVQSDGRVEPGEWGGGITLCGANNILTDFYIYYKL